MDAPLKVSDADEGRDKKREPKEKRDKERRHRRTKKADEVAAGENQTEEVERIEAKPAPTPPRWQMLNMQAKKDESGASLLPGEELVKAFPSASIFNPANSKPSPTPVGSLCLTNFRIYFRMKDQPIMDGKTVAITDIGTLSKSKKHGNGIKLLCKDGRKIIVLIAEQATRREAYKMLFAAVFPTKGAEFFATKFKYIAKGGAADEGWRVFDEVAEYTRLGLPSDLYRVTEVNRKYALCRSYPELLFVPKSITDQQLLQVAKFRSSHRIPVITWLHPRSGATLTRCSQPMVGLLNHKSKEDTILMATLIAAAPKSNGKLVMLDPRPSANASANKLRGGGVEDLGVYKGCTLEFGDIENIHVVRNNLTKLWKLVRKSIAKNGATLPQNFSALYTETGWPQQLCVILRQAQRIVDEMTAGVPVLVHCSDGWDRTCQTIALAELCMDHYYRTVRGLAVLIEKEWIAYGHKFAQRHGVDKNIGKEKDEQRAPIFFQFLDCLYQLLRQYPTAFEFTAELLVALADHVQSSLFGTFLANNVAERAEMKLPLETTSFWTYALHAGDTAACGFLNANFQPTADTLKMCNTLNEMHLFEPYFLRWASPSPPGFNYLLRTFDDTR